MDYNESSERMQSNYPLPGVIDASHDPPEDVTRLTMGENGPYPSNVGESNEDTTANESDPAAAQWAMGMEGHQGASFVDADGVTFEWDGERRGWFPKIDEDFLAMYHLNYGTNHQPEKPSTDDQSLTADTAQAQDIQANVMAAPDKPTASSQPADKGRRKRAMERNEWFEVSAERNTNVYIEGLPLDITLNEVSEFMSKCGLVKMENDKPRIKLYRSSNGNLKGDGLCSYLKVESVALALDLLDGQEIKPGYPIKLQKATFEQKGEYRKSKKAKRKKKNAQEKLLGWSERVMAGAPPKKVMSVVVLKNLFDPAEFEDDPVAITDIQSDVASECEKCGKFKKVLVFDRHMEGVVSVQFSELEAAERCIKLMNGRWFGGRQIRAEHWDGHTDYKVEETDHDRERREKGWEKFISEEGQSPATANQGHPESSGTANQEQTENAGTANQDQTKDAVTANQDQPEQA